MVNIFALRSTDPSLLYTSPDPIGPENDSYICEAVKKSDLTVLAWGNHGEHLNRGEYVMKLLSEFDTHCLIKTNKGQPGHPLYLRKDISPVRWYYCGSIKRADKGNPLQNLAPRVKGEGV